MNVIDNEPWEAHKYAELDAALSEFEGDSALQQTINVWADGSWAYPSEMSEYGWKSDDYKVVQIGLELDDEGIDEVALASVA